MLLRRTYLYLLPLPAWCMYSALQWLVSHTCPWLLRAFPDFNETDQLILTIIEIMVLGVLNHLRVYLADAIQTTLPQPLPHGYIFMFLYAVCCWVAGTATVLCLLWQIPFTFSAGIFFQLLVLSAGIGLLMGMAVPWSAARFGILWWYERKLRLLSKHYKGH